MHADEIIQLKEWRELNAGEKQTVKELAETESEYNLIKKMLQVSAEEAVQVPIIADRVKKDLTIFIGFKKVAYKRYFYAAAAVIVILLIATVFIKNGNDSQQKIAINDSSTKKAINSIAHINIEPKDSQAIVPAKKETIVKILVHNKVPSSRTNYDLKSTDMNDDHQPIYASVNKTISQEKELLDLVTEMY